MVCIDGYFLNVSFTIQCRDVSCRMACFMSVTIPILYISSICGHFSWYLCDRLACIDDVVRYISARTQPPTYTEYSVWRSTTGTVPHLVLCYCLLAGLAHITLLL